MRICRGGWTSIRTSFVSNRRWPFRRCTSTPPTPATTHRPPHRKSWRSSIVLGKASLRQRSEEHTSELQSRVDLVCRLLLEKKKKHKKIIKRKKKKRQKK